MTIVESDHTGLGLWLCPACQRQLSHPRFAPVGCMGIIHPVGECPMHRTVVPRGDRRAMREQLDALAQAGVIG